MKLSDYLVRYLEKITDSVFLLSGGGIMHVVDSLSRSNLNVYCCHHEQAAATAAEGYSRINAVQAQGKIGVCVVTTGPGGTNAITGVAGAWLDSIPILVISGQVKRDNITPRADGRPIIRQLGFQEINIIDLVGPITKYADTVEKEEEILFHLEKAIFLATNGRPGPVWLEIPLDVQAAEIDSEKLAPFVPPAIQKPDIPMAEIVGMLEKAKRPLLMAGNGIRLAGGEEILWKVLENLKINAITPFFTADDLITYEYPYYLGRQGIPGNETANWAVDNCDLLLIIGERIQLTQTSYEYKNFATQATKIMVDIDEGELKKKTLQIDIPVHCDAKIFLEELYEQNIKLNRWQVKVKPINPEDYGGKKNYVNVYSFLEELNKCSKGLSVATADGMASVAPHQVIKIKRGQRFITNAGFGQMGSGLPLAIGASVALGKKPVICTEGDGSIMLNLQELQTVLHHQLPLKIFIFNNNGYYSIRTTHLRYFNKVFASDPQTGVSLPNFEKLIKSWGFEYRKITNNNELFKVREVIDFKGPIVCELMIDPDQPMLPRWEAGLLREK